ncbi:hypothetical protein [Staphylospora marina]|uniref:hypothetical protein n=1 Tax=Staphylospora marina TaxID=2490858 RepID=UPI000F5BE2A5|nr:hypothetical protein [Staphylospora marina]
MRLIGRFLLETAFVTGAFLVLKTWFFPLVINWWFPDPRMAEPLVEWTAVLAATLFLIAQIGLGSSGKHQHGLGPLHAAAAFWGLHLAIGFVPGIAASWQSLPGDPVARIFSDMPLPPFGWMMVCFLLQLLGRGIRIVDPEADRSIRAKRALRKSEAS